MVAAVLPLTSDRPNRPTGTPIVRAELDAAGLTLEAYRVYGHLSCHARPTLLESAIHWGVCRSLNRIAKECFGASYPNTTEEVLRRKAGEAIAELCDRNMIVRQRHQPGVTLANLYLLLPMECWQEPTASFRNPNVRKGRGCRTFPTDPPTIASHQATDPPRITLVPPIDPPTIYLDQLQNVTSDTLLQGSSTLDRSSQDQDLYVLDIGLSRSSKEREREKGENTFSLKNKQPEQDEDFVAATNGGYLEERTKAAVVPGSVQVCEKLADHPQTQGQDAECSAAVGAPEKSNFAKFDAIAYDWRRYHRAGDGGSHPKFFEYMLRSMQAYSEGRRREGKEPVCSLISYTLSKIRNNGEALYHEFEIEQGWRSPPPKPPKPTPQPQPSKQPTASQPADPIAIWQQISENLNLRPADMLLPALEQELRHTSRNSTAKDAVDRMQWLLKTNPQWGFVLKDGKLISVVPVADDQTDLTDLLLALKWRFQKLGFDRERRSQWLQQHYGTTLQAMSSQQLETCLADLKTLSTINKP